MNNELNEIRDTMYEIHFAMATERDMSESSARCEDFEKAIEVGNLSKQTHEQLSKQLSEQLNNYIDYPIQKWWIIKHQKKATCKPRYSAFDHSFDGYNIEVPYIDKQEYHCVVTLLDETPCIHNLYNKWYLH